MKRVLLALAVSAMAFAGLGVAHASDPHKTQDQGLCTAFFNGQKNGWEKNGTPPPFQDLMTRAGDGSDSGSTVGDPADVYDYCYGLIGGNPDHGRYDCTKGAAQDDPTTPTVDESQTTCQNNPAPGKS